MRAFEIPTEWVLTGSEQQGGNRKKSVNAITVLGTEWVLEVWGLLKCLPWECFTQN